jgi:hypothetical protein
MLAHAEIVIAAPHNDLLRPARRVWQMANSEREAAGAAFQISKDPIPAFDFRSSTAFVNARS